MDVNEIAVKDELFARLKECRCISCGKLTGVVPIGFAITVPIPTGMRLTGFKVCEKCREHIIKNLGG